MVMNLVAPSPSRMMACASSVATAVTPSASAAYSALLVSPTSGMCAVPVAINMKESLVEVSPSTVMQLNDRFAACAASARAMGNASLASVATKPSIVAMLGWIMPAPLAIPDGDLCGPDRDATGSRLGHSVGGHDRLRGGEPVVLAGISQARGQSGHDFLD